MQVLIADPIKQTVLVIVPLVAALLLSLRRVTRKEAFPPDLTRELKGFAILAVVFAHVGFGLASDLRYMQPLSFMGGVAVNVFLFLSGLGLATSADKHELKPGEFYRRRFLPVLIPLWITLTALYLADRFILHQSYPLAIIAGSYAGFFPSAVLQTDLDSPLWYLTLLFSFYAAFPWLYRKARPYASALLLTAFSMLFVLAVRPLVGTTIWLYVFHGAAFPIGVIAAHLLTHVPRKPLATLVRPEIRAIIVLVCAVIAAYTAVRSDVGQWDEQIVSMVTVLSLCGLFAFLPVRFALLDLFGAFAFEIYLFHWPLMYRYDILFRVLSPAAATLAYLGVFIAGGWLLQQCSAPLIKRWTGKGA